MAQHDYVIANGTGAAVRSDLNNALAAIVSQNSGATAPSTTYAYMPWADSTTGLYKIRNAANNGWITLYQLDGEWSTLAIENGSAAAPSIYFKDSGTDTGIYSPGTDQVAISTGGTGRLFVDSSGRVLIGTSTARSSAGVTGQFQVEGTSFNTSSISLINNVNSNQCSYLTFGKSRSGSIGGSTVVQSGDLLGYIQFAGADGTDVESIGADIAAYVDGTPGANDMPGRIVLSTTADGASSPTERMRITSAGLVGIGTTSPSQLFHLAANNCNFYLQPVSNAEARIQAEGGTAGTGTAITFHNYNGSANGERARIDSSGRLLVGTTSTTGFVPPGESFTTAATVQVSGSSAAGSSSYQATDTNTGDYALGGSIFLNKRPSNDSGIGNGHTFGSILFAGWDTAALRVGASIRAASDGQVWASGDCPSRLVFSTTADGASSPTERMRIASNGVWTAFNDGVYNFRTAQANSGAAAGIDLTHSSTGIGNGTLSFRVFTNGNVVNTNSSYGAISDIKLKENIVDANSQWSDVKALRIRNYNFKPETGHETHKQLGLIAQEVELVSPGLVSASHDRDEDGNETGEVTKSVAYSVLYMKAVKALQEAMERIEQLETEMAAVKAQLS
jgi:hypothetical protein